MNKSSIKENKNTVLLFRLIVFLIFLSLSRILMYFFNQNYFSEILTRDLFLIYFKGLRFDIAALMMLNFPFILFSVIPFNFKHKEKARRIILYITLFINSLAIIFNLIDVVYFRFTLKRSTFDLFNFLDANVGLLDIFKAILFDFWYMILLAGAMLFLMIYLSLRLKENTINSKQSPIQAIYKSFLFFFISGIAILGMRGGTQLKPINLIDAGRMVSSNQVPLILNTPFSLIVTYGKQALESKSWYTPEDANTYFNPIHKYGKEGLSPNKKNIVVIILESFSTNKIGYFNSSQKSLTPFLDSILNESLTFKGIANGKKSITGIPAILSGIPTLMRQPFLTSSYASNQFSSLAAILKNHGYTTAFFHGGKNGTMNFDSYTMNAGFDTYYGLNEYENKEDYDGSWGIWDHDFYPFFNSKLNAFQEPFLAAFFSLSSHHPYAIPKIFESEFSESEPLDNSIAYSDYALSKFFESAKKEDWFNNTLFVITADHTAELPNTQGSASIVHFEIPIAFYSPNDTTLRITEHRQVIQQSDILPSVMDYLNFKEPFVAFGNSIFDTLAPDFALYYLNEIYHGISANSIFEFNGEKFIFENIGATSSAFDDQNQAILKKQTKALIQNYAAFMIDNKLSATGQR